MLIEFSVTNYRSFLGTQCLSMAAGSKAEPLVENTFEAPTTGKLRLLRSAVIYGPNAAGKSNLVKALAFVREFILNSSKERQEGESIERTPFLLNADSKNQPSEFEIFFIQNGVRYQYGFACTEDRVTSEWLLVYPKNRAQRWLERNFDPETKQEDWDFGINFKGSKKTWKESTRPNALFLSTAIQLNCEQLKPILQWFKKLVVIEHGDLMGDEFSASCCEDLAKKDRILTFVQNADIQISNIVVEEEKISPEDIPFPKDMPNEIKRVIKKDLDGRTIKRVNFLHKTSDPSGDVPMDIEDESDGTLKLFSYAGPLMDIMEQGRVLVVDEFNNSFHPLIIEYLLKIIHNDEMNRANGQLIFTTHDTSLLDQDILRRDQVWFMEKDENQDSTLYSLLEFKPRKNEALRRGYIQGRYGALPYIGEVRF
ncbi:MAG: ATP-binding protein [Desulfatibacillum sp.]|nr:ATP-binding protein [Desulfatibacillum sp.]